RRLLAAASVVREVDRQDRRVAEPSGRDLRDVVDPDLHRAEVRPVARVLPVRPEGDVLLAARLAEVPGVAGRALDAEARDEPFRKRLVEAAARDLLVADVRVRLLERGERLLEADADRLEAGRGRLQQRRVEAALRQQRMERGEAETVRFDQALRRRLRRPGLLA